MFSVAGKFEWLIRLGNVGFRVEALGFRALGLGFRMRFGLGSGFRCGLIGPYLTS